jgi:hypothetical protein
LHSWAITCFSVSLVSLAGVVSTVVMV